MNEDNNLATSRSKPIGGCDDDALNLAREMLVDLDTGKPIPTGWVNIDQIGSDKKGAYVVVELLKCDTKRPHDSHPNKYWHLNSRKFLRLWDITKKLGGRLYLINYELSREQFKVIIVEEMTTKGIIKERAWKGGVDNFQKWYIKKNMQSLNAPEPWSLKNQE